MITEAVMKVHPNPPVKDYHGILFPDIESGAAAIHEAICRNANPTMFRLQDSEETKLAFSMRHPSTGISGFIQKQMKKYLAAKGYNEPCMMMAGFEGTAEDVRAMRNKLLPILKKNRGFHLGNSVGKTFSKNKFAVPYLRDILMNHGCWADVAETAAVWSKLLPLYHAARNAVKEQFKREGYPGYLGCHISHSYIDGASLYFTMAAKQVASHELEHYYRFKRLITETFMEHGGTLTHHHAVGYEHRPWMEREVTRPGLTLLRGMKRALDPDGIMNPGKLIPPEGESTDAPTCASETSRRGSAGTSMGGVEFARCPPSPVRRDPRWRRRQNKVPAFSDCRAQNCTAPVSLRSCKATRPWFHENRLQTRFPQAPVSQSPPTCAARPAGWSRFGPLLKSDPGFAQQTTSHRAAQNARRRRTSTPPASARIQ